MKEETKPKTTPEVTAAEKPLPKPEVPKETKEHPEDMITRAREERKLMEEDTERMKVKKDRRESMMDKK